MEESNRINAEPVYGEQQLMLYQDFKDWCEARRLWGRDIISYERLVDVYAEDRGWKQESFSGMEIIG